MVTPLPYYLGIGRSLVQLQIVQLYLPDVRCGDIGGRNGLWAGLRCLIQYLLCLLLIGEVVTSFLTGIGHDV